MVKIRTLGPVGFNPTGEYDGTRQYQKLDVVYYEGSSYVATTDSIGQLPTNTNYWDCIAVGYLKQNVYDTVADMKADDTLKNGMYAQTLGYYSANDGGGATYKITDTESVTEHQEIVGDLFATLINNGTVNVKQFGAYGDGTHNDTKSFVDALVYGDIVYVNETKNSYKVNYLVVPEGKILIGKGYDKVQVDIARETSLVISGMRNNSKIENIKVNALDEEKANNRFDINNRTNITLINCEFSGFRDTATSNAWGILLTNAKYVTIKDCYFSNNTQSDIAIVSGCEHITIERCSGNNLHINIEPIAIPYVKFININNCEIDKIDIRENNYLYNIIQGVTIKDSIINLLEYDGGKTALINCIVKNYQPQDTTNQFAGNIEFINTGNFSENLLSDPYLDNFTPNANFNTPWGNAYQPTGIQLALSYSKEGEENIFEINPSNTASGVSIKHKPIEINASLTYLLKIRGGAHYPSGSNNISKIARIEWMNDDEEILQTQEPSFFRGEQDSNVPIHDEYLILKPIENATKLQIVLRNSPYGIQTLKIASVELFELKSNEINTTQLKPLPINRKRIFTGSEVNSQINYAVGDIMYYETPTSYIGKVRTIGNYNGTWKDFGPIS